MVVRIHKTNLILLVVIVLNSVVDLINGFLVVSGKVGFVSLGVVYRLFGMVHLIGITD